MAAAIAAILQRPGSAGRVYELGGKDLLTYREILGQALRGKERQQVLVPVPFALWRLAAGLLAVLPRPPLTISEVQLMTMDNVADPELPGFAELGISPRGVLEAL